MKRGKDENDNSKKNCKSPKKILKLSGATSKWISGDVKEKEEKKGESGCGSPYSVLLRSVFQLDTPKDYMIFIVYGERQYNEFIKKFQKKEKLKKFFLAFLAVVNEKNRKCIVVRGDCWNDSVVSFSTQLAAVWRHLNKNLRPLIITVNPPMGITLAAMSAASLKLKITHCCTSKRFYLIMKSIYEDITEEKSNEVFFAADSCVACLKSVEDHRAKSMFCDHLICANCLEKNDRCPARIFSTQQLDEKDSVECDNLLYYFDAPAVMETKSVGSGATLFQQNLLLNFFGMPEKELNFDNNDELNLSQSCVNHTPEIVDMQPNLLKEDFCDDDHDNFVANESILSQSDINDIFDKIPECTDMLSKLFKEEEEDDDDDDWSKLEPLPGFSKTPNGGYRMKKIHARDKDYVRDFPSDPSCEIVQDFSSDPLYEILMCKSPPNARRQKERMEYDNIFRSAQQNLFGATNTL